MLKRLHVDNFRCLSNFDLEPAQVSALVGPNGGGKSAVLEVFRSLQGLLIGGEQVDRVLPPWSRTRWDTRLSQRIELDVEHDEESFTYELSIAHDQEGAGARVHEERLSAGGSVLYRIADGQVELFGDDPAPAPRTSFPFVATRSFLPMLESCPDNQRIIAFKRWLSGIYLFALNPWSIEPVSQGEGSSIAIDGRNFVSWYRTLVQESPEVGARLLADLTPVIPGLSTIRLLPLGLNSRALSLECTIADREFQLNISELSEGQRALLVLYTILRALAPSATLLVFDEPDNFVA